MSVFGDIRRRADGKQVKKEDDIDIKIDQFLKDMEERRKEYIKKNKLVAATWSYPTIKKFKRV